MRRRMCKSKIHRATVTDANLHYQGSITLAGDLLDAADIRAFEQVQVVNVTNGERFETYAVRGEPGSGMVVVNGAAARLVQPGDTVIVFAYADFEEDELEAFVPRFVFVDEKNRIARESADRRIA